MNKQVIIALAGLALLAFSTVLVFNKTHSLQASDDVAAEWKLFKQTYHKKFADPDYEQYRYQVFQQNYKTVQSNPSNYGMTQFLDLTTEEFKETYLTLATSSDMVNTKTYAAPTQDFDWVAAKRTTPVKNQGQCGSCWAFSTTGVLEGFALKNETQKNYSFSEQQLVDCDTDDEGCNGGLMENGLNYVIKNGITFEKNYPYTANKGDCKQSTGEYKIAEIENIKGDCNELYTALTDGPVAVAVDATNFQYYTKGVFSNCKAALNHGVLLTGYTQSTNSWTIKNSWGASWGENGFIRLAYGNTCGVCNMATYITKGIN